MGEELNEFEMEIEEIDETDDMYKPKSISWQSKDESGSLKPENVSTLNENGRNVETSRAAAENQLNTIFHKSMENDNKTLREATRDVLYMASANQLAQNEDFSKKYQDEHGKQILEDLKKEGKLQAIVASARKQEARNSRNKSFFEAFKPFFTDFMGINDSFGLIPMLLCVVVLYAPYLLISVLFNSIKFIVIGVNLIFKEIGTFVKIAKYICMALVVGVICVAVVLALLYGIQNVFGAQIFPI